MDRTAWEVVLVGLIRAAGTKIRSGACYLMLNNDDDNA